MSGNRTSNISFRVPCCDVRCDFRIQTMYGSSLSPVVCRRVHVLFTLCSVRLYLQLFVGGFMCYLRYVRFVFISSCL